MKKIQNSILNTRQDLLEEKTNCKDIVTEYLRRIKATQNLNIYLEVFAEEALQRAAALDAQRATAPESIGRLHGLVISIKDVLCYEGHKVTAASKILEGFESLFTATALQRLLDEDAIIIGRVNCDQFAMGSSNENSVYGPTRNPIDERRVPGGSSGASAAAVAAGTCLASIGSDTGGSVRQPAGFCGIVGLKPSYGRISRYGLLAYASSFDQIGILSQNVEDAALLLEIMAGEDVRDSTSSQRPVERYSEAKAFEGQARIAYFGQSIENEGVDSEIKTAMNDLIGALRTKGHVVSSVPFDLMEYIIPAYYVLTTAEASSNLSRYDGVRYGHRAKDAATLEETYTHSRSEGFSEEVKRRIMLGTYVLSSGYYDAYYAQAQRARRLIAERTSAILKDFDFILMPVSPIAPWAIGEKTNDPVAMYLADIYTVQANMVGLPAIALPLARHENGLPIGVQFMAGKFEESKLLSFAGKIFKDFCGLD
jgi:aspartyl-tRNA(Asn)/glutamyl-tRNA(Gln) amidotransferase subunit A